MSGGLTLLDVSGDARERGRTHGRAFSGQIAKNLETYLARFAASGCAPEDALAEGVRWLDAIAGEAPEYAEEMAGIAEGSELPPNAVALINARYEIAFSLYGREARAPEILSCEPEGCTTFGLLPEAVANGHTIVGQNWDWLAAISGNCLVLRVHRTDKPRLICLTEAGIVGGKMGVNECGIGLVENGLASAADGANPYAKPFHVRCREILDANCLNDALLPVVRTRRPSSAHFMVGCATGEIVSLETSPDLVTSASPVAGIITHSNHFLDGRHGESQMERLSPSTLFRAARLDRRLRRMRGSLDRSAIEEALRDHASFPQAICRHVDERQDLERRTMTLASTVIDLDERVMWIANGNPCVTPYNRYPLD